MIIIILPRRLTEKQLMEEGYYIHMVMQHIDANNNSHFLLLG